MQLGMPKDNIFVLTSGDVLELSEDRAEVVDKVQVGAVLVDGLGVGDVGNVVLRDRQILSENGIMIIVLVVDSATGMFISMPHLVTRGFIYVRESDELMEEMNELLYTVAEDLEERGVRDIPKIRSSLRDALSDYVWKKMNRRPMIMPIILEV